MSTITLYVGVFILCYLVHLTNLVYVGEVHQRMKWKVIHLDRELVLEAFRNYERVLHLKSFYEVDPGYEIGQLVYKMRSRFTRMIRLFILSHRNLQVYNHTQHIKHLVEIQAIAMELDALVELLDSWNKYGSKTVNKALPPKFLDPNFNNTMIGDQTISGPKPPKRFLRNSKDQMKFGDQKNIMHQVTPKYLNSEPFVMYQDGFDSDVN